MLSNKYTLPVCLIVSITQSFGVAYANNIGLDDGVWSGGLRVSGNGRNDIIQATLSQFNEMSKLELNLSGWNDIFAECTYYSKNYTSFELSLSESSSSGKCLDEVTVSYISSDHQEAVINVLDHVDNLPLQALLPNPASMPELREPAKSIDILGISPGISEEEALARVAELGYSELFEPTESRRIYSRGENFTNIWGFESQPDILTLTILSTVEGNLVSAVHRAEQFPSNDVAADPYVRAFSEKYGDHEFRGINYTVRFNYTYDGQPSEYLDSCAPRRLPTPTSPGGYTDSTSASLMGGQLDMNCAYHVAYTLRASDGLIQSYALLSASPRVDLMALYPKWVEEQAAALANSISLMSSTTKPEL